MPRKQKTLLTILGLAVAASSVLTVFLQHAAADDFSHGPKKPIIWNKPVPGVVFYHLPHTRDFGLDCMMCHGGLFEFSAGAAEQNDDFTMEAMYAGKYCGACHDGSMAYAANTRCTTCHIGVKGVKRLLNAEQGR